MGMGLRSINVQSIGEIEFWALSAISSIPTDIYS